METFNAKTSNELTTALLYEEKMNKNDELDDLTLPFAQATATIATHQAASDWRCYPAMRRAVLSSTDGGVTALSRGPPPNCTLIPTGGNALQAMPLSDLDPSAEMVSVVVPPNAKPGMSILVVTPDGSGRLMEVLIPEGAYPGHTFLVLPAFQPKASDINTTGVSSPVQWNDGRLAANTQVVPGHDVETAHSLRLELEPPERQVQAAATTSSSTMDNQQAFTR